MWIARNKDGSLFLFDSKPFRVRFDNGHNDEYSEYWSVDYKSWIGTALPEKYFPNLKWSDDPLEVEVVSKKFVDAANKRNEIYLKYI